MLQLVVVNSLCAHAVQMCANTEAIEVAYVASDGTEKVAIG